ncbi:MAG TPA: hypothetical protein PKK94_27025 [Leptospiraceae bacterium]|nr:hypothetical protein [Leptospiraceae bacterium]
MKPYIKSAFILCLVTGIPFFLSGAGTSVSSIVMLSDPSKIPAGAMYFSPMGSLFTGVFLFVFGCLGIFSFFLRKSTKALIPARIYGILLIGFIFSFPAALVGSIVMGFIVVLFSTFGLWISFILFRREK